MGKIEYHYFWSRLKDLKNLAFVCDKILDRQSFKLIVCVSIQNTISSIYTLNKMSAALLKMLSSYNYCLVLVLTGQLVKQ